jgi:hypothetical protein
MALEMYIECDKCQDLIGPMRSVKDFIVLRETGWRLITGVSTMCPTCVEVEFQQMATVKQ